MDGRPRAHRIYVLVLNLEANALECSSEKVEVIVLVFRPGDDKFAHRCHRLRVHHAAHSNCLKLGQSETEKRWAYLPMETRTTAQSMIGMRAEKCCLANARSQIKLVRFVRARKHRRVTTCSRIDLLDLDHLRQRRLPVGSATFMGLYASSAPHHAFGLHRACTRSHGPLLW